MIEDVRSKSKRRTFKPVHEKPGDFHQDYILLPYGVFYERTKGLLSAKAGDILRFFNGPEYPIERVELIEGRMCDVLCRMRYGISWEAAFRKWQKYATLDGHTKDILSKDHCIMVIYGKEEARVESGAGPRD